MASFEIEIKSLLGIKDNADKLIKRLQLDPSFQSLGSHMQLNHYFINGDLHKLSDKLSLSLDSSFGKAKGFPFWSPSRHTSIIAFANFCAKVSYSPYVFPVYLPFGPIAGIFLR